jgi:hypothetical protein
MAKTIRNDKSNTSITWLDKPHEGKPLTRFWVGPNPDGGPLPDMARTGDTPEHRDQEISALLRPHATQTQTDWRLL